MGLLTSVSLVRIQHGPPAFIRGLNMPKIKAENKAEIYNRMAKHPAISYGVVSYGHENFAVAQFYGEQQVGIVYS